MLPLWGLSYLGLLVGGLKQTCVCTQSYPTVCDPKDCSPPSSSVHGILQAGILEWVSVSSFRGSSWPRDRTQVSCISCISRWILYHCATWEAPLKQIHVHEYSQQHFHSSQKVETNQIPVDGWKVNKMWSIIRGNISHKNEWSLIHDTVWINLRFITQSERSQTQKVTKCVIPFIWNVQKRQIHQDRKQPSGSGAEGGVTRRDCLWEQGSLLGWWKRSTIRYCWWLHNFVNAQCPWIVCSL